MIYLLISQLMYLTLKKWKTWFIANRIYFSSILKSSSMKKIHFYNILSYLCLCYALFLLWSVHFWRRDGESLWEIPPGDSSLAVQEARLPGRPDGAQRPSGLHPVVLWGSCAGNWTKISHYAKYVPQLNPGLLLEPLISNF